MDGDGFWRTDEQMVGAIAEDYFKTIFATSHPNNVDEVLGGGLCSDRGNELVSKPAFCGQGGEASIIPNVPIEVTESRWYVPLLFLEILALSRRRGNRGSAIYL